MIITLCGSKAKAIDLFEDANFQLTIRGVIILTIGTLLEFNLPLWRKVIVDKLHFDKIKMSDAILVLDKGGYIGESTNNEIEYARSIGVPVIYLGSLIDGGEEFTQDEAWQILIDWDDIHKLLEEKSCHKMQPVTEPAKVAKRKKTQKQKIGSQI